MMLPQTKLDALLARHAAVEAELSRQLPPEALVKLSREFAEIDPVVDKIKAYRSVAADIADLEALIADPRPKPPCARWRTMSGARWRKSANGCSRSCAWRSCPRMPWTSAT
jgi:hypothetical protein